MQTKKHAYLIIAHSNFYVLEIALKLIDDERNDVYIHIDKKVKDFDFEYYCGLCRFSNVYFTKKRYSVKWGSPVLVKAEMLLFDMAYKNKYDYYHLISGSDLPIKSQDHIHSFFDANRYQFITATDLDIYRFRLSKFNFDLGIPINKKAAPYLYTIQNKLKIDRMKHDNHTIYKGSEWVSISHECVGLLLRNKRWIMKRIRFSLCADEIYKQTVILNSHIANKVYPGGNMRLIDWERRENESPHTFTIDDYEMIMESDCLFARKFVAEKDREIIDKIYRMVCDREIRA